MSRKTIDCREFPSEANCTISISANDESELIDLAAAHAVRTHGHADSEQLRSQLHDMMKDTALA